MQAHPAQKQEQQTVSPLEQLSTLLRDDMTKVNGLIMEKMQSDVALIPQVASYLIAAGGKRLRPLLTLASTRLFDTETKRPYALAAAVEFIHTATLLHDDVVDGSAQRRGQEATNLVFGNQASVLVGDFLFSRSFQLMVEDGSLEVLRILSEASAVIAEGEVMQMQLAGDINLTMAQYEKIISAKTAALFAAACEIGPVIAGADSKYQKAMRDYGYYLGMAFQIADDILDYSAHQETLGKDIGDDFREGKLTAPVLFAIEKADDDERRFWKRTMADKQQNNEDFACALDLIKKHDALSSSITLARTYHDKALESLNIIDNTPLKKMLEDTVTFTISRDF